MSYKLKTLIVFDTNSLRSTETGEVAYSFFAFGKPFQDIENFITNNNLTDEVHLAVSDWAITELKDQKQKQYLADVEEYKSLAKRLSGLPHTGEITFPDSEFNCAEYVEQKAVEFLSTKQIKRLSIPEAVANTVLCSMMSRVMRGEKKSPFVSLGKYKDAGFKDNLVWESLMIYEEVPNYDKVIFLTRDGDFNRHCEAEFKAKWNKHIAIVTQENNVIAEINRDYENYIKERAIHEFAQTEYFADYLNDELKTKAIIIIEGIEYYIANYVITNICKKVNRLPPNEDEIENLLVSTEINIHFTQGAETKVQVVIATTKLEDEETKQIISTEYDIELI